ncbi:hypothetical protein NL676_022176 [Syzygium grande]|nr:hypothetical protein NL676_022176 [Syzygium grande]
MGDSSDEIGLDLGAQTCLAPLGKRKRTVSGSSARTIQAKHLLPVLTYCPSPPGSVPERIRVVDPRFISRSQAKKIERCSSSAAGPIAHCLYELTSLRRRWGLQLNSLLKRPRSIDP